MSKKMKGGLGHASKPKKCDPIAAQQRDVKKLNKKPNIDRGYPMQANG